MRQMLTGKFLKMSKFIVLFGAIKIYFKERKMNEFVIATEKKIKELEIELTEKLTLLQKIERIKFEISKIIDEINGDIVKLAKKAGLHLKSNSVWSEINAYETLCNDTVKLKNYHFIKQNYGVEIPSSFKIWDLLNDKSDDFYRNHKEAIHFLDILTTGCPILSAEISRIQKEIKNSKQRLNSQKIFAEKLPCD